MSQLQTYEHFEAIEIVALEDVALAPGAWVRHKRHPGAFGILVSRDDDSNTVLWSQQPQLHSKKFVQNDYFGTLIVSTIKL